MVRVLLRMGVRSTKLQVFSKFSILAFGCLHSLSLGYGETYNKLVDFGFFTNTTGPNSHPKKFSVIYSPSN